MANFKPGDVVRCVRPDGILTTRGVVGELFTVDYQDSDNTFAPIGRSYTWFKNDRFVLDDTTIVSKILDKYEI